MWILLALTVAVGALAAATGGRSSDFISLLFFPVLLAVVRFPFRAIFLVSLALAFVYLLLPLGRPSGPWLDERDVIRIGCLVLVALFGGLYVRHVESERERWKGAVEEREALLNVSQVVNSCNKLEPALNSALLMLQSIVPGVRCMAIYLTDEGGNHLVRQADIGKKMGGLLVERLRTDSLADGWSLNAVQPYVSQGETAAVAHDVAPAFAPGSVCYCYVGLRSLNVPVGLLYVEFESSGTPGPAQLRMLRGIGERIGFPIHKIRMQEGLHNLAYTDPMTGLQNYRAFRSSLDDEWKRASRYRRPLSLILIDLDHFKDINDRYGHPAGDRLLAGVAGILRDTVRETDLPARYGGEEFVVVCPETSETDADIVAERIRTAVESARFQIESHESTAITCSLGIATFPSNATTEEALIDAADAALYYAKRCGKNAVRSADSLPFLASDTGS